ncbi:hypothetical protein MHK_008150 [Candidatus Magnetomorum sp. HK-1]|nr:hypothetical protein MHK_008150 [Candidatus Magnetomorum sp. HK-1]
MVNFRLPQVVNFRLPFPLSLTVTDVNRLTDTQSFIYDILPVEQLITAIDGNVDDYYGIDISIQIFIDITLNKLKLNLILIYNH